MDKNACGGREGRGRVERPEPTEWHDARDLPVPYRAYHQQRAWVAGQIAAPGTTSRSNPSYRVLLGDIVLGFVPLCLVTDRWRMSAISPLFPRLGGPGRPCTGPEPSGEATACNWGLGPFMRLSGDPQDLPLDFLVVPVELCFVCGPVAGQGRAGHIQEQQLVWCVA